MCHGWKFQFLGSESFFSFHESKCKLQIFNVHLQFTVTVFSSYAPYFLAMHLMILSIYSSISIIKQALDLTTRFFC